jgi:hypothetical protein
MISEFHPIEAAFRPLKAHERELLEKLIEPAFVGRDELRLQLNSVIAQQVLEDGTVFLRCDPGSPAPGKWALKMEAEWTDADGGPGCVMLHVNKDGYMSMLDILKYGPSEIIDPPTARNIVLLKPAETL